ncbi:hypothetical protein A3F66_01695 [candidate division TM6 bacterium RIFCSPHIGHO2_12_FULL_32_22]|nr:MAG: hypothetical protein A3F66_01695 [candidate division TM6 bacterium RIFCSPHIGHO2_12_FULL_32_22]
MKIYSNFLSGKIKVISLVSNHVKLALEVDNHTKKGQWFYFKVYSTKNTKLIIELNVKNSYYNGWEDYNVFISYDQKAWFTVRTSFDGENISFFIFLRNNILFASYLIPFSFEKYRNLKSYLNNFDYCSTVSLGITKLGNILQLISCKKRSALKKVWFISQQHSGETLGQFILDSFLHNLVNEYNQLLDTYEFFVIHNANPDGTFLGNMRHNSEGVDLNRAWHNSLTKSLEVTLILQRMQKEGVDILIDLHCDELSDKIYYVPPIIRDHDFSLQQRKFEKCLIKSAKIKKLDNINAIKGANDPGMLVNYAPKLFNCVTVLIELPCKFQVGINVERLLHKVGIAFLQALEAFQDN